MYDSIPICRSVFKHWIYDDAEYLKVWLTMLGRARYLKDPKKIMFEGTLAEVNYGEFIFGYNAWNKNTGVSVQRLRRLIKTLVDDGMISSTVRTNRFTIFSINNYEKFNSQSDQEPQGVEGYSQQSINSQSTVKQQSSNSETTTNKESIKKDKKVKKNKYSEFVTMTTVEYDRLTNEFGQDAVIRMIEILNNYKGSKGKKYDSDNLAIRSWVIKRYQEEQNQTVLFASKPKMSKREQQLDELERVMMDYDRGNECKDSQDVCNELRQLR